MISGSLARHAHDHVRQPGGDAREDAEQDDGDEHQADEGQHAPDDVLERNVRRDVLDDEDVEADRRVDQAHFHDHGHHDTEPDQVETGGLQRRQDDRRGHQDDRYWRQEEAEDDHEDQDGGEQQPLREVHGDDPFGRRLADVQVAHHVGVEQRHADDEHQHGRFFERAVEDRLQLRRPPDAVDTGDQGEGQDAAETGGFRRRRITAVERGHDADQEQHEGNDAGQH